MTAVEALEIEITDQAELERRFAGERMFNVLGDENAVRGRNVLLPDADRGLVHVLRPDRLLPERHANRRARGARKTGSSPHDLWTFFPCGETGS